MALVVRSASDSLPFVYDYMAATASDDVGPISEATTRSLVLERSGGDTVATISESVEATKLTPTTERSFVVIIS